MVISILKWAVFLAWLFVLGFFSLLRGKDTIGLSREDEG